MNAFCISLVLIVVLSYGLSILLKFADGPWGPLPGGVLRNGTQVTNEEIDWSTVLDRETISIIEFQTEHSRASRLVGVFLYEGELYASCDLGFIGRRAPSILMRFIQRTVLSLKNWHEQILSNGNVVLRMKGKLYKRLATKVTDQTLIARFKEISIREGTKYFGYLEPAESPPGDIWFFHLAYRKN